MVDPGSRPPPDVARIVAVLRGVGAEFVVVGSAAGWAHGVGRRPGDVDCVIRDDWANFERCADALIRLRARPSIAGLSAAEAAQLTTRVDAALLADMPVSSWVTEAGELDLLDGVLVRDGGRWRSVEYDDLAARSVRRRFGPVTAAVAGLDDLIAAKQAADRGPVDAADLDQLVQLRAARAARGPSRRRHDRDHGLDL